MYMCIYIVGFVMLHDLWHMDGICICPCAHEYICKYTCVKTHLCIGGRREISLAKYLKGQVFLSLSLSLSLCIYMYVCIFMYIRVYLHPCTGSVGNLCRVLQHTATHRTTMHHTAPHCIALQHNATHQRFEQDSRRFLQSAASSGPRRVSGCALPRRSLAGVLCVCMCVCMCVCVCVRVWVYTFVCMHVYIYVYN